MYTLYLPKYQGDHGEYLITKTITEYMHVINYDCVILLSPGYMSKTNNTIKLFVDKFSNTLTPCVKAGIPQIGIFNGMNGSQKTSSSSSTIRDEHNLQIRGSTKISLIDINCVSKRDHRKMMFFLERKGVLPARLDFSNKSLFLANVDVKGIMIGSSNQSLATYYGGQNPSSANHGEADVFMFIDESFFKWLMELRESGSNSILSSAVLSKSISVPKKDMDYLKDILTDFLDNSLA